MNETDISTRRKQPIPELVGTQARLDSLAEAEHATCFLCGQAHAFGPKLRFTVQPDGSVAAPFACHEELRSYAETLHGGVISALLDSAMTNALFAIGMVCVTAELNVRFLAPVALNQTADVHGFIERDAHPLYYVRAELIQDGKLKARATAKFLRKGFI